MSTNGSSLESRTLETLLGVADWGSHDIPQAPSMDWIDDPDTSTLASLLEVADRGRYGRATRGVPWRRGHELAIVGWGGVFDRSGRRVTITAGPMQSYVQTHRSVNIAADETFVCDQDLSITVGAPPADEESDTGTSSDGSDTGTTTDEALAGVAWGNETVRVGGDMHWKYHDRKLTVHGAVNRVWLGGITRFVGMEGIICAGAFVRTLAGLSTTLGAVASGDVYGGCVRTSGARTVIAGLNYRSMDSGAWSCGTYSRLTSSTIVPVAPSPNAAAASMLAKAAKVGLGVMPFADIALGMLGLLLMPLKLLWALINKARGIPPKPPTVAPRMLTRTVGAGTAVTTSEVHT